ncbi:MAG TPA: EI24 domain-containing protein [bacterium]|nr:EI24 domain-containing protein [bacterium]
MRRFLRGAGFVPRGILFLLRNRWTWPLAFVPVLFAVVVLVAVTAFSWLGVAAFAGWVFAFFDDRFAARTSPGVASALAILALVVVASGIALAGVLLFAELVKAVGQPFWKEMTARMEAQEGGAPADAPGSGRAILALRDSAVLVAIWLAIATPLLLLGLVPVVGQTIVPAAEALLAAWVVAAELTQIPLDRRGMRALERHRFLRAHKAEAFGFGLAALAVFLLPLANVFLLPGAVLGGAMLVRDLEART